MSEKNLLDALEFGKQLIKRKEDIMSSESYAWKELQRERDKVEKLRAVFIALQNTLNTAIVMVEQALEDTEDKE